MEQQEEGQLLAIFVCPFKKTISSEFCFETGTGQILTIRKQQCTTDLQEMFWNNNAKGNLVPFLLLFILVVPFSASYPLVPKNNDYIKF